MSIKKSAISLEVADFFVSLQQNEALKEWLPGHSNPNCRLRCLFFYVIDGVQIVFCLGLSALICSPLFRHI